MKLLIDKRTDLKNVKIFLKNMFLNIKEILNKIDENVAVLGLNY